MTTKIQQEPILWLCHLSKKHTNMITDKDIELEIIELLDLAKSIKSRIAGFASKDHKHDEYAPKEHEHDYAAKGHKHTDYASKEHVHEDYAAKEHSHTEYAAKEHEHDYAPKEHSHEDYASKEHEHEGYALKDHKHTDYAKKTHSHADYALKEHSHADYAAKEHEHEGYAAKEHSHPELEQLIAESVPKVFFLTTGAELAMVEDQMQPIILTHTGATPKHLYDFFGKTARFNCPNYIVAPGKTFAARICLHQGTLFVLSDGILTD